MEAPPPGRIRDRLEQSFVSRLSPERTRRPTLVERLTVRRLQCVRAALFLGLLAPTIVFFLAHSTIGFARWRLQRELWRRDVERLQQVRDKH